MAGRPIPKLNLKAPVDPRSRTVVKVTKKGRDKLLELDCGHWQLRRPMIMPDRVICVDCPHAGGMGGRDFEKPR